MTRFLLGENAEVGEIRMTQDVDKWIAELKAAGWNKHATLPDMWVAPDGNWYRGPHKAWQVMKTDARIHSEERQSGVDISFEEDVL